MQIHLIQLNILWRQKQANFKKVEELVDALSPAAQDLVVLPEMFATGFDVEFGELAEGQGEHLEATGDFLAGLARKYSLYVQGSGISRGLSGKRRNLVVVYNPDGKQISSFTKLHPFTFGGEHKRFEAGEGIVLWKWGPWTVAPLLCYDLRFPEAFRAAVSLGADLFTIPANWPSPRQNHWLPLLRARAIENQAYVVGVNRCGRDKFLEYAGESVVYDAYGNEVLLAGATEGVWSCTPDRSALMEWRQKFPVLGDRRRFDN